jgi:hypothetical protein
MKIASIADRHEATRDEQVAVLSDVIERIRAGRVVSFACVTVDPDGDAAVSVYLGGSQYAMAGAMEAAKLAVLDEVQRA